MRKYVKEGLLTAVAVVIGMTAGVPSKAVADDMVLSSETLAELAQVRNATARYHNILNAFADGYIDAEFPVPGVGCHLINLAYVFDMQIVLEQPDVLVYSDCSPTAVGGAELRAVEYALVCVTGDCADTPMPEGYSGDSDAWVVFPGVPERAIPPQWSLHAWVWRHNPAGMFVTINPQLLDE
jgi:hypothetical protein